MRVWDRQPLAGDGREVDHALPAGPLAAPDVELALGLARVEYLTQRERVVGGGASVACERVCAIVEPLRGSGLRPG